MLLDPTCSLNVIDDKCEIIAYEVNSIEIKNKFEIELTFQ
jgi:hypothetical protein